MRLTRRREFFALLLAIGAMLVCHSRALAAAELCPAYDTPLVAVGMSSSKGPAITFGFHLWAYSGRSTAGSVALLTDQGWYRFAYPTVTLTSVGDAQLPRFDSPLIYVRFDKPVTIVESWIEKARASGDSAGWEKQREFACDPPQGDPYHPFVPPSPAPGSQTVPQPILHRCPSPHGARAS